MIEGGFPMGSLRRQAAVLALCAAAAATTVAPAQAEDPYYKGKRLTVLINFAVGGPADIESRVLARYLGRHIDGQPSVIVQNMDGAGGLIGSQYLGEIAPKDGTIVGALTGSAWVYASDPERWRVDFRNYEFIARQPSTTIHFVRTDVAPGIKVPADIVKAKGLIAGGLSADTSKDLRLRLALDMLGVPYKYVTGYRSSPPARLALQRGEINMFSESPPSYRAVVVPELINSGLAIPAFYDEVTEQTAPALQRQLEGLNIPSFPQLYRQIKSVPPSGELWDAYRVLFEMNSTLLRVIALPPGTPPAAAAALSRAIERVNHDKDFAAEAMKVMEFVPEYETAPDMSQKVRAMLVTTPEMRNYINTYMRNVPKR
jgi:tripartite-type tricarboxylate transporter receptor subunit TctC